MSVDKLKFHVDEAETVEQAAAHMGIFLEWAATQGFLAAHHDVLKLNADPVRYVVDECPNLGENDFTREGYAFAREGYGEYLEYLGEHASDLDLSSYEYAAGVEARDDMFECLNEALQEFLDEQDG